MNATRSLSTTLDRMITLNRALDQALWGDSRTWAPATDIVEKHDAYVVYAELPGVDASKIDIKFERNILTISGAKEPAYDASKNGDVRVYSAERATGAFERSLRLPQVVDGDNITAEFTNGLLTVTIPKAQAAQPRRIAITTPDKQIASN